MSTLIPTHLRCEYLTNPLAVDEARPRLSWVLESADPAARGQRQTAYQVLVTQDDGTAAWDSQVVRSDESLRVRYAGAALRAGKRYHWKVRVWDEVGQVSDWSAPAAWTMGVWGPGWTHQTCGETPAPAASAEWIGVPLPAAWSETESLPAAMLRRSFQLPGAVRRAMLYASALGLYELYCNGQRVGEAVLAPEWTDYHQKAQYQGYDVSALLLPGENALGALLGAGWYAGRIGMAENFGGAWRGLYGRRLALVAQLRVELENGEAFFLATDGSWKSTDSGPIRSADLLDGEVYDARLEMPGWSSPGYADSAWRPAAILKGPALVAQPNEPIRITRRLAPIDLREPTPGVYIYDLGQNMVGWPRLRLHGAAGAEIRIRYGEVLNPDGTLYRDNLREAGQIDLYICRGAESEDFEPHFTYHGFRYVEVSGLAYRPAPGDLTGCVFHSAAPEVGQLQTSSPLLNKIMAAIQWTQRSNLHSTPTDCPQRDERLGWMGDAQVFAQTAVFNMDMAAFFTKWARDIREAQAKDGRFPDFAPQPYDPNQRFSGNPGWGDAGVLMPWVHYVNYGDTDLLAEQFDAAKRYIDWSVASNPDLIWRNASQLYPLWYGDWLNADTFADLSGIPRKGGEVPKEIYSTAFLAHSAQRVAQMASILGRKQDAARYRSLAARIRAAFNRAFVSPDGHIQGNTQAGYALALNFDLLPARLAPRAAAWMVKALEPYDGSLSTGIQSTMRMMVELSRYGYHQEAYALMMRTATPSWGYMVEHGGTTIWERWDGWVEGRGFQNPSMNSFNHYAIGAVGEWMYRVIGGLNPDPAAPGWKHFTLRPVPGGGLTWAQASYDSIRGRVSCGWEQDGAGLTVTVTVPANTSAEVVLPAGANSLVTESGQPAAQAPGVLAAGRQDGWAAFAVASGTYTFRVTPPQAA